jgi:hypothetical protein
MYIQRRHWLDYDPVALAVLVIGIRHDRTARIDHLMPLISTAKSGMNTLIKDCAMWQSNLRERNAFYEWTITGDDTQRRVARALRICVGNEVRKLYGDVPNEPIPSKIADLLHRLDQYNKPPGDLLQVEVP